MDYTTKESLSVCVCVIRVPVNQQNFEKGLECILGKSGFILSCGSFYYFMYYDEAILQRKTATW